ncbi:MAG TPA: hypothetical protein V6C71_18385 [Coleofasciculaceae cyanobacterium]
MAVTIDLFSDVNDQVDGDQAVIDTTDDSTPVTDTNTSLTGVIGGQRTISVEKLTGVGEDATKFSIRQTTQDAILSSDSGVQPRFSILYDGDFSAGGTDLTNENTQKSFLVNILENDLGASLAFDVTDIDNNTSTITQSVAAGATGNTFFRFDQATGSANLTTAESITFRSTNAPENLDMRFDFIETSAVPFEFSPSMGLVFFGGLFGVHRLKKRLKSC